jgi:hypothetical protein
VVLHWGSVGFDDHNFLLEEDQMEVEIYLEIGAKCG